MSNNCQTDDHGQFKYHYCKKRGDGSQICNLNKKGGSKPAPRSKECKSFFNHTVTPKDIPAGIDEIMIIKDKSKAASGDNVVYCYRQFSPSDIDKNKGWCHIQGDFYNPQTVDKSVKGWGFCSRDCFLDENQAVSGRLRAVKDRQVLKDLLCEEFLNYSLPLFPVVRPKILCVGMRKDWNTEIWRKTKKSSYEKMDVDEAGDLIDSGAHFGDHIGNFIFSHLPKYASFYSSAVKCYLLQHTF